jgi:hypothetical protein
MADVAAVEPPVLSRGGWRVEQVFAAGQAPHFWAFYDGEDFGHAERGLLAVLATAHASRPDEAQAARRSAQLVAYSFAEGFFGARRTFGAKRAAGLALESMNSWLFGQIRADNAQYFAPVSVTGVIFSGPLVGIAHVGAGRFYRRRAGKITPLTRAHVRQGADGREVLRRAIGLDNEISVDFFEEAAEAGDDFLLLAGPAEEGADGLAQVFDLTGAADAAGNAAVGAAMRLRVLAAPPADAARRLGDLQTLPIKPPPREGDVWDGFKIGKTIYRGRYTLLKAARDIFENRDVALKIPLPTMLQDEVFAAGFMREAWIGTTIRGENIARYIDLPEDRRSSLYLVMPFYAGETLEARLGRGPLMSLPDGVGIALKLCEAVQDLAAIQVIHRDIKPDNILLLPGNKVKLIDLGLAYLPGIDVAEAVKPGGTLRYMAPELLKGVQANARTEVFALAVTFYRMFAGGAFPFGQREGVPLKRMRPDLPEWLGRILGRGFAEDPAARFADAGEMAAALQEGLVTGESDAPPPAFSLLGFSALQVWQAAAVGLGVAFLVLLARVLKG